MIWHVRIKEQRELHHLTLKDVASRLGITEATAQRYESTIKNIPYENIVALAKIFNCTPSYLMGWDDSAAAELSEDENRILTYYRSMNAEGKTMASNLIESLARNPKYKELGFDEEICSA